jgi:phospholipid-binding lipoprotein MlaA
MTKKLWLLLLLAGPAVALRAENADETDMAATPAGEAVAPAAPSADQPEGAAPESSDESDFEEFAPQENAAPVRDPLIWFNRAMYQFNDKMYFWVLKPVARGYRFIVPQGVRLGVNRVFKNVAFPSRLVGNVLQGKGRGAGRETARFLINSTLGVGGFFDPARKWWDIQPSEEDFGQVLGRWGMGPGFPLVLPVVGPSGLRDALGLAPDYFLNPISYLDPHDPWFFNETRLIVRSVEITNRTSLELGKYETLKKDALDPYTYIRDFYRQVRERQVKE